jgi:hypothetical protein
LNDQEVDLEEVQQNFDQQMNKEDEMALRQPF